MSSFVCRCSSSRCCSSACCFSTAASCAASSLTRAAVSASARRFSASSRRFSSSRISSSAALSRSDSMCSCCSISSVRRFASATCCLRISSNFSVSAFTSSSIRWSCSVSVRRLLLPCCASAARLASWAAMSGGASGFGGTLPAAGGAPCGPFALWNLSSAAVSGGGAIRVGAFNGVAGRITGLGSLGGPLTRRERAALAPLPRAGGASTLAGASGTLPSEPGAAELRMVVILYTGVASSCCSKQPSSSSSSSSTESALRAMFTARDIIRGAAARAAAPRAAEELFVHRQ